MRVFIVIFKKNIYLSHRYCVSVVMSYMKCFVYDLSAAIINQQDSFKLIFFLNNGIVNHQGIEICAIFR